MHTITATFNNATTYTRRTEAAYTHASRTERGEVTFHKTYEAAHRAAGRFGEVVRTNFEAKREPCFVCEGTGKTASRSAVTGEITHFTCHRCGGTGQIESA